MCYIICVRIFARIHTGAILKNSDKPILPISLNDIQHQMMIGGLLGDSHLGQGRKDYIRLKIDRQYRDLPYLEWQYNLYKDCCSSGIREYTKEDKRYNTNYKYCSFRTRGVPAFIDYYNKWYGSGTRQVPEDIEFTPLILAVWFADDGCMLMMAA